MGSVLPCAAAVRSVAKVDVVGWICCRTRLPNVALSFSVKDVFFFLC